jgi:hypothetical protein
VKRAAPVLAAAALWLAAPSHAQTVAQTVAQTRAQTGAPSVTPVADVAGAIRAGVVLKGGAAGDGALDAAEISPLRATFGPELGDTMLCLRTPLAGQPVYIAVFFEGGRVLDYRRAVAIDRCAGAVYAPLPKAPPPKRARAR